MESIKERQEAVDLQEKHLLDERRQIDLNICAVRRQRNSICAVSRLPIELLSIILLHAFYSYDPFSPARFSLPVTLSQVSARWREVALSTPRLFAELSMRMVDTRSTTRSTSETAKWFTERIRRTKAVPVDLSLHIFDDPLQRAHKVMESLLPVFDRCHSLDILITSRASLRLVIEYSFVDMPLLEHLSISALISCPRFRVPLAVSKHQLKSLSLRNIALELCTGAVVLETLASLHLDSAIIIEVYDSVIQPKDVPSFQLSSLSHPHIPFNQEIELSILQYTTSLESLRITDQPLNVLKPVANVELSKLRVVCISLEDNLNESCKHLFTTVQMPSLRSLSLYGESFSRVLPSIDDALSVLTGMAPAIDHLSISHALYQPHSLLSLLATLPLLRTLNLSSTSISNVLLSGLKPEKRIMLCPDLKELNLSSRQGKTSQMPGYHPFTAKALEKMLKARKDARLTHATGLQKLVLLALSYPRLSASELSNLQLHVPHVVRMSKDM